ncbi:MAG: Bug family tripartite tricarboxylate transporter substrate binding protein [Xanthobacteraceae bacterium]
MMMRRHRRSAVAVMGLAAMALATIAAGSGRAQTVYPERVIKLIVPAPAGGQTDVMARLMAQKMQQSLGQSVVIENRAGAGGALGARAAAAADPDGYTLFYGNTSTLAVIPAVSKNAGYDPVKNYAPVASVSESYMILVVHPSFPARTIQEFLAYAKANPGKLNYAHAGAGNVTHLTGEMFRTLAGIDFVNVPHKGGNESVQSVLGNQVDFALESPVILLPLIKEGKVRALAITSGKRQAEIADVPTMLESGINGFVATLLTGVVAPAGTPAPIVGKLNSVINESLKSPDMKDLVVRFGSAARIGSPRDFGTFLAGETQKWANIAKQAGVALD